jgi:hypothetical protein
MLVRREVCPTCHRRRPDILPRIALAMVAAIMVVFGAAIVA